ncbi:hypothetical protein D1BOALGB6SA_9765 [Olavius sp. associated proteobacterium Delta 1]|nr:hypothetical protein D1BOALGB6SA_9765 [Olavius sp. associated proteobacterium Delta 1]
MDDISRKSRILGLLFLGGYYIEIGTMSIVEDRLWKWECGMRKLEGGNKAKV